MAVFDESKVINALHTDRAEVGKKYYFADYLGILKERVEDDGGPFVNELTSIEDSDNCCFSIAGSRYALLYPYEEPPKKKRMSNRQLAEWLAKGNGEVTKLHWSGAYQSYDYDKSCADEAMPNDYVIRHWNSDTWIEPTYDVYLIDCKHISQDEIEDAAYRDGC